MAQSELTVKTVTDSARRVFADQAIEVKSYGDLLGVVFRGHLFIYYPVLENWLFAVAPHSRRPHLLQGMGLPVKCRDDAINRIGDWMMDSRPSH